jgi:radical SAM-linked protein
MTETRQRWRLVIARGEAARQLVHRELTAAWETALRASGLPLAMTDGPMPRPRITFGAPVPVGMLAEREPLDIRLVERWRIHEVREAVEAVLPSGQRLVDLYDVWPGSSTLAASIVAGEYRVSAEPVALPPPIQMAPATEPPDGELDRAVAALLAAPRIVRRRAKGGGTVEVDIRPHLLDLAVTAAADGSLVLRMRLRLGGEGGVGRPDEVVAALGERLERTIVVREVVRERVILTDGPA